MGSSGGTPGTIPQRGPAVTRAHLPAPRGSAAVTPPRTPPARIDGARNAAAPDAPLPTDAAIATVADGIGVRVPVPAAVADLRELAVETRTVEDAALREAMRLVHRHASLVVEPAGVAALLAEPGARRGRRVATVRCGGNVTPEQMRHWLAAKDAHP